MKRLVKVIVQPVFLEDDGEHLKEIPVPSITISAEEWPSYASEALAREIEKL